MFFKSATHRQMFLSVIQDTEHGVHDGKIDGEYGAAVYILISEVWIWDRVQSFVHRRGIRFDDILSNVDFSSGYLTLIKLARDLFKSSHDTNDPFRIIGYLNLDEENYQVFVTALDIRRNPPYLADAEKEHEQ